MEKVLTFISKEDILNGGFMTNELMPCPFCGSNRIITAGTINPTTRNIVYKAFCSNSDCGACVHLCLGGEEMANESRSGVVKKWNRRTIN